MGTCFALIARDFQVVVADASPSVEEKMTDPMHAAHQMLILSQACFAFSSLGSSASKSGRYAEEHDGDLRRQGFKLLWDLVRVDLPASIQGQHVFSYVL